MTRIEVDLINAVARAYYKSCFTLAFRNPSRSYRELLPPYTPGLIRCYIQYSHRLPDTFRNSLYNLGFIEIGFDEIVVLIITVVVE